MTFQELHNNLKARCKKAAAEGRPFEDLFSAFQSEMIRQGIALAENQAEKIYIYILDYYDSFYLYILRLYGETKKVFRCFALKRQRIHVAA